MVRANGLAKLLDFGIAKLSAPTDSGDDTSTAFRSQTRAGVIIGTRSYMSPEQARGLPVDHQTDIFSLGVVMHHMLSGQSPFAERHRQRCDRGGIDQGAATPHRGPGGAGRHREQDAAERHATSLSLGE